MIAKAPIIEPVKVRAMRSGARRRSIAFLPLKDSVPPVLIKTSASMFVAIADLGSIPNSIIAGTVISEVLPVTTLTTLVRKKMLTRAENSRGVRQGGRIVILNNSSNVLRPRLFPLF